MTHLDTTRAKPVIGESGDTMHTPSRADRYVHPQSLCPLSHTAQEGKASAISAFVRHHFICIKNNELLVHLRGKSAEVFLEEASYYGRILFGREFMLPTAPAAWQHGEVYVPAQSTHRQKLRFPLVTDPTAQLAENDRPRIALPVLRAPDLQVAYAALAIIHGSELLAHRRDAAVWLMELEKLPTIKRLREAERRALPDPWAAHLEERDPVLGAIRRSIENGNTTQDAIHRDLKNNPLHHHIGRNKISDTLTYIGFNRTVVKSEHLNNLLQEGERDIGYLCERLDVSPLSLWSLFHEKPRFVSCSTSSETPGPIGMRELSYKELSPLFDSDELEAMVRRGASLNDIAKEVFSGRTREHARQQLEARNINGIRSRQKQRRAHASEQSSWKERQELLCTLTQRALVGLSAPQRMAFIHRIQPGNHASFQDLLQVYTALEEGKRAGLSFPAVAKRLKMPYGTLYQLIRMGPFPESASIRHRAEAAEIDTMLPRIERCVELGFSLRTIEAFLGRRVSHFTPPVKAVERQSFRTASLVYEAVDAGFTTEETAELLEIQLFRVASALANRASFEPKIIEGLRILFDDPMIDRPYR